MNSPAHCDLVISGDINDILLTRLLTEIQDERYQRDIPLRLFLNSPGGSMPLALATARLLLSSFDSIETYNLATVDSAAVCLYLIGSRRYAFTSSRFYLHPPSIQHENPLEQRSIHELSLLLQSDTNSMLAFYHERTGLSLDKLATWFNQHIVLPAELAVTEYISTEICHNIADFSPRYILSHPLQREPMTPSDPLSTSLPPNKANTETAYRGLPVS